MQIDAVLQDISETALINLPDDGPSSLQDLISVNEVFTFSHTPYNSRRILRLQDLSLLHK